MQNNENITSLQYLLSQISEHIYIINIIINKMTNIMNQMNSPMINQINNLMINQMNNFPNFNQGMNCDFNLNNSLQNNKLNLANIIFDHCNGTKLAIIVDKNKTIGELLNLYFEKIKKPGLINNYENLYYFEYNNMKIEKYKEKKIKDILRENCHVLAKKKGEMFIKGKCKIIMN